MNNTVFIISFLYIYIQEDEMNKRVFIIFFLYISLQGDEVNKTVFIIFFQGDQLKSRVKKICEG